MDRRLTASRMPAPGRAGAKTPFQFARNSARTEMRICMHLAAGAVRLDATARSLTPHALDILGRIMDDPPSGHRPVARTIVSAP